MMMPADLNVILPEIILAVYAMAGSAGGGLFGKDDMAPSADLADRRAHDGGWLSGSACNGRVAPLLLSMACSSMTIFARFAKVT